MGSTVISPSNKGHSADRKSNPEPKAADPGAAARPASSAPASDVDPVVSPQTPEQPLSPSLSQSQSQAISAAPRPASPLLNKSLSLKLKEGLGQADDVSGSQNVSGSQTVSRTTSRSGTQDPQGLSGQSVPPSSQGSWLGASVPGLDRATSTGREVGSGMGGKRPLWCPLPSLFPPQKWVCFGEVQQKSRRIFCTPRGGGG